MRGVRDVTRSIQKHLAATLGDAWEVTTADEEGGFLPPHAFVEPVSSVSITRQGFHSYRLIQPFSINAYLPDAPDKTSARDAALGLVDQLIEVYEGSYTPRRIPLFDYAGHTLQMTSTARAPHDYIRVEDFSATPIEDSADGRKQRVAVDLRVSWMRATPRPGGRPIQSVRAHVVPIVPQDPRTVVVGASLVQQFNVLEAADIVGRSLTQQFDVQ